MYLQLKLPVETFNSTYETFILSNHSKIINSYKYWVKCIFKYPYKHCEVSNRQQKFCGWLWQAYSDFNWNVSPVTSLIVVASSGLLQLPLLLCPDLHRRLWLHHKAPVLTVTSSGSGRMHFSQFAGCVHASNQSVGSNISVNLCNDAWGECLFWLIGLPRSQIFASPSRQEEVE